MIEKITKEQLLLLEKENKLGGQKLGVPIEVYHETGSPAVSKSDLDLINSEPYLYYAKRKLGLDPETKRPEAFLVGQMVHEALLEPHKFSVYETDKEILSLGSRLTKAYKEGIKEWEIENTGKVLVKDDIYSQVNSMVQSATSIDLVKELLSEGEPEMSYYWNNPETGLLCKCRPDYVKVGKRSWISEVKTTADPMRFELEVAKRRYHVQAAHCLEGIQKVTNCDPHTLVFIFIVVGKSFPYTVRLMMLDDSSLILGDKIRLRNLETVKKCNETGLFPRKCELKSWGTPNIETIKLPSYEFYNEEFGEI